MEKASKMIALLLAAVAAPVPLPTARPPFPIEYAGDVDTLLPGELERMRAGAWRFCTTRSKDRPEICMTLQDAAILHLAETRRELRAYRASHAFDQTHADRCQRIYEEDGTGDLRPLEDCLELLNIVSAETGRTR